jgi:hypothetical protein
VIQPETGFANLATRRYAKRVAPRLALIVACAAFAASAASCAALLDLPAPTLEDGGVATVDSTPPLPDASDSWMDTGVGGEAGRDQSLQDTTPDSVAPPDVAPDTLGSDAGGVLCGTSPSDLCDPTSAKQYCCETLNDASTPVYTCVSGENACPSPAYYIGCANDNDCPGNAICCHYSSHMICENQSTCPGGGVIQACDHNNPNSNECPSGQSCTLHLTNLGAPSPYWGCQ